MTLRNTFVLIAACAAGLAAGSVHAQTNFDATAIAAGGISSGDTAGYPATLSNPGMSFKLTSPISNTTTTVPTIDITGNDITLDLNGFVAGQTAGCAITGSVPVNNCTAGAGQPVIRVSGSNVTIKNGNVNGSQGSGIGITGTPYGITIVDVVVRGARNYGIDANVQMARLKNVRSDVNGTTGIRVDASAVLENVSASYNNQHGILASSAAAIDVSARNNGLDGFRLSRGSISSGYFTSNLQNGINGTGGEVSIHNVSTSGNGNGVSAFGVNIVSGVLSSSSAPDGANLGVGCYHGFYGSIFSGVGC